MSGQRKRKSPTKAKDDAVSASVTVTNARGLHARAAAAFARVAGRFDADVTVMARGHSVSALSIMGLLMLAATRQTEIGIQATGADAAVAVAALAQLVENRFEEDDKADT